MTSLTNGVGETFNDPHFAGSGAIDCLYVDGPRAAEFTAATKTTNTFGSDHFSVSTVYTKP